MILVCVTRQKPVLFYRTSSLYLAEDFSDNEEMFAKEISKWNSNDLMDKIETIEVDEAQGGLCFYLDT